jgi:hypothetical protein
MLAPGGHTITDGFIMEIIPCTTIRPGEFLVISLKLNMHDYLPWEQEVPAAMGHPPYVQKYREQQQPVDATTGEPLTAPFERDLMSQFAGAKLTEPYRG